MKMKTFKIKVKQVMIVAADVEDVLLKLKLL